MQATRETALTAPLHSPSSSRQYSIRSQAISRNEEFHSARSEHSSGRRSGSAEDNYSSALQQYDNTNKEQHQQAEYQEADANADANAVLVRSFYTALAQNEPMKAQQLLTPELDCWYYGPPAMHHMKRLLEGHVSCSDIFFQPTKDVFVKGSRVFVEGFCTGSAPNTNSHWLHIWTVCHGRLARLREYVNTSVTVMDAAVVPKSNPNPNPNNNSHVVWHNSVEHSPGLIIYCQ